MYTRVQSVAQVVCGLRRRGLRVLGQASHQGGDMHDDAVVEDATEQIHGHHDAQTSMSCYSTRRSYYCMY